MPLSEQKAIGYAMQMSRQSDALLPESTSPATVPTAHRLRRFSTLFAIVLLALILLAVAVVSKRPRLNAQERMLLGAWEWQGSPGSMVLYFDDGGTLTYSQPPFTSFQFDKWKIDDAGKIHFTIAGKGLLKTVGRLVAPQTWIYQIRFVNGTVILTLGDRSKVLIPYTGSATANLKTAK